MPHLFNGEYFYMTIYKFKIGRVQGSKLRASCCCSREHTSMFVHQFSSSCSYTCHYILCKRHSNISIVASTFSSFGCGFESHNRLCWLSKHGQSFTLTLVESHNGFVCLLHELCIAFISPTLTYRNNQNTVFTTWNHAHRNRFAFSRRMCGSRSGHHLAHY